MDLSTTYLGLELENPLMPGASPLADELDSVRALEDAGAGAIVLRSLFEEQIVADQLGALAHLDSHSEGFAEAMSFFPSTPTFAMGIDEYLAHLRRVKDAVDVPVIASLNGTSMGGWLRFAKQLAEAGADALELNVYFLATDPAEDAASIERRLVQMVHATSAQIHIPIAVKISPFFTALPHLSRELFRAGAAGLVVFNRFYQPDLDIEELTVTRSLRLSTSDELLLRLRWLAILSEQTELSLAITGGVHSSADVVKSIMCGAHAVQMVSSLLRRGPDHLSAVKSELTTWLEAHEYESLRQMQGSMNLSRSPDPGAYERGNYMELLQSWST